MASIAKTGSYYVISFEGTNVEKKTDDKWPVWITHLSELNSESKNRNRWYENMVA